MSYVKFWADAANNFDTTKADNDTLYFVTNTGKLYKGNTLIADKTDYDTVLEKTTYEYNKELALGNTGKVCIGQFPMYDSNISVEIKSTTGIPYHGVLIISTQNIDLVRGGTFTAKVYGDADNSLTDRIKVRYASGSNVFSVYIDLPTWSKNLLHIQCVSLAGTPTNIATKVDSIPTDNLITVTNALTAAFAPTTRAITAGAGLAGGGTLAADRTIKADLVSETKLTNAAAAATETANRVYPIALDKNGKLAVNVPWTDTKVKQTSKSDNVNYPILTGPNGGTSGTAYEAYYNSGIYLNPSTKTITATKFAGKATSAETADTLSAVLGVSLGGTGVSSISPNQLLYYSNTNKTFVPSGHYIDNDFVAINSTSKPATAFHVEGDAFATGNLIADTDVKVAGGNVTLTYNSTKKSLDFIFA